MSSLMDQYGAKAGDVSKFCLSPDNARIPLRMNRSTEGSNSISSYSSFNSSPRIRPSRWSNASPTTAAVAVKTAVLLSENRGHFKGSSNSRDSSTSFCLNCVDGSVRARTCPKELLQSSMGSSGGDSSTSHSGSRSEFSSLPLSPRQVPDDRWAGKSSVSKCAPPSPPCRRKSSASDIFKQARTSSTAKTTATDFMEYGNSSLNSIYSICKPTRFSDGPRRRRSLDTFIVPPHQGGGSKPVEGDLDDEESISSATIHTKNTSTLSKSNNNSLSPEKFHYEKTRINSLIQRLPDSLRAPPY